MRQVGRELEREQRVVELQHLAHVGAERRIGRQFEQAAVVVGQLQLARRAQHAEAVDAAQLADADLERLAVIAAAATRRRPAPAARGCRRAHSARRRRSAAGRPSSARRHRRGTPAACRHSGAGSASTISATTTPENGGATGAQLFDLHARHRQQVGQLLGSTAAGCRTRAASSRGIASSRELAYLNCDRKRRSPSKNRRRSLTP